MNRNNDTMRMYWYYVKWFLTYLRIYVYVGKYKLVSAVLNRNVGDGTILAKETMNADYVHDSIGKKYQLSCCYRFFFFFFLFFSLLFFLFICSFRQTDIITIRKCMNRYVVESRRKLLELEKIQ